MLFHLPFSWARCTTKSGMSMAIVMTCALLGTTTHHQRATTALITVWTNHPMDPINGVILVGHRLLLIGQLQITGITGIPGIPLQITGAGYTQPLIGHIQPALIGHIQPLIGHIQPLIGHIQPLIGHIQSLIGHIQSLKW